MRVPVQHYDRVKRYDSVGPTYIVYKIIPAHNYKSISAFITLTRIELIPENYQKPLDKSLILSVPLLDIMKHYYRFIVPNDLVVEAITGRISISNSYKNVRISSSHLEGFPFI